MSALSPARFLTAWQFSWPGLLLAALLVVAYLPAWVKARGRTAALPVWRMVGYLVLGVGSVVYVTCGPVGVYAPYLMWMFALQVAVISAVTPIGLAMGRPVEAWAAAVGEERVRPVFRGKFARFLMFPMLSSVLAAVSVLLIFYTGYGQAALENSAVQFVLLVQLLFVGILVVLPLLTEDLLPSWATAPVRTLIALLDGLVDAIPGIVVMTASGLLMPHFPGFAPQHASVHSISPSLDQRLAGGALLAVAESIGIPMLCLVFVEWLRSDDAETKRIDAQLDEEYAADESYSSVPWWEQQNR